MVFSSYRYLILLALTARSCAQCIASMGGTSYDLSSLANTDWHYTDADYLYHLTFCGVNPACSNGALCQLFHSQPPPIIMIGAWGSPVFSGPDSSQTIQTTFTNGDSSGCSAARQVTLKLVCGSSNGFQSIIESSTPCQYTLLFNTPLLCPGASGGSGSGGSGSGSSLSGGWVFVIIVLVVSCVYCAGGIVYKRQRLGVTEWRESVPNIELWAELPGLVKDGCLFSLAKVRGWCGQGDGTYTPLPDNNASHASYASYASDASHPSAASMSNTGASASYY